MRQIPADEMMFELHGSGLKGPGGKVLIPFFARCACVAILATAVLTVFAEASVQQLTRVRIGLAGRNFSFLPFFVAEQQKIFRARGNPG